jgi:hypothetical protein
MSLLFVKKPVKMQDPIRFPKVIEGYEGVAKHNYDKTLSQTFLEITKYLKEQVIK